MSDAILGTYAPRCARCGWRDERRGYTAATLTTQRALALSQFVQHKTECPAIPPAQEARDV